MALKTKEQDDNNAKPLSKREKIKALALKHKPLFQQEGVSNPKFIPRLCYRHTTGDLIIGLYPKEIYGGVDVYTEFCDKDYNSEDPDRKLWKWVYNSEFETEYDTSSPHPVTGDRRYLIPIDELVDVANCHKEPELSEETFENLPTPGSDVPYEAMTLRDYAAIIWRKPVSQREWLNNLIHKTFE